MSVDEQINAIAATADRKARFTQLRRDMRYMKRVMVAYEHAISVGPGRNWPERYHSMEDAYRRMGSRYGAETAFRMRGAIIRTFHLRRT